MDLSPATSRTTRYSIIDRSYGQYHDIGGGRKEKEANLKVGAWTKSLHNSVVLASWVPDRLYLITSKARHPPLATKAIAPSIWRFYY